MADETRTLAKFTADLTCEQVPGHVRAQAIDNLVDQIGCEIGCSDLPWARQVRDTYRATGGTPEATVVRYGDRLPAATAAFINGTFGHSFEFDDANRGHPGTELIPPLVAIAERDHACGRDFLTAFIAAYEVRGRIGKAMVTDMMERGGPHPSSTIGPFGVAAGVAKLLGLGAEDIHNALGIAGAFCGGLMQYAHSGGSVKRIYTAVAASNGIQAAHLARAGITGPEGILEGARGLMQMFAAVPRPQVLVANLGERWMFETMSLKPYSCVGVIAAAIDGLRNLKVAHNLKAEDIESIEVGYLKAFYKHAAITSPHDMLGMQFSTAYSLALTMLKGRNTPREYTMENLNDPEIRAFASRVHVGEDLELTKQFAGRRSLSARVKVRTKANKVYEDVVINAKGSPSVPLSKDEVDDKFRFQVVDVLGAANCEKVLRTLRNIDTLDDMAKLPAMLVCAA